MLSHVLSLSHSCDPHTCPVCRGSHAPGRTGRQHSWVLTIAHGETIHRQVTRGTGGVASKYLALGFKRNYEAVQTDNLHHRGRLSTEAFARREMADGWRLAGAMRCYGGSQLMAGNEMLQLCLLSCFAPSSTRPVMIFGFAPRVGTTRPI